MRTCMHLVCWLVFMGITLKTEACEDTPARCRGQLELHSDCPKSVSKEEIRSRLWIEYRNDKMKIVQSASDNWGPVLYNQNETLLLQVIDSKYVKENISYVCNSTLFNESSVLCGSYCVKGFECRQGMPETIDPQNLTNLEIGSPALFTCTHYFSCDRFGANLSVTMRAKAKNNIVSCNISNFGLEQSCQLRIPSLGAEDFEKPVQCIVNDSGNITIYEAFPFRKDIIVIPGNESKILVIIILGITVPLVILIFMIIFRCIYTSYRLRNKYKVLNFFEDKECSQVLLYSVNEGNELLTSIPFLEPLNNFLQDYNLASYSDVPYGHNITEEFSKLAIKSVALIILVEHQLLNKTEYENRFNNLLQSDAVKGKTKIWPYYTTILYLHKDCPNNGDSCCIKNSESKNFYSLELKDGQNMETITRKLRKRLPPIDRKSSSIESVEDIFEQMICNTSDTCNRTSKISSCMISDTPGYMSAASNVCGYMSEASNACGYMSEASNTCGYMSEASNTCGYMSEVINACGYMSETSNASSYMSEKSYNSSYMSERSNTSGYMSETSITSGNLTSHSHGDIFSNLMVNSGIGPYCIGKMSHQCPYQNDYSRMNSNTSCCSKTPLIS